MLKFKVGYKTRWGENLFLRSGERSWAMEYEAGELWSAEIDENELFGDEDNVEYYYEVRTDGIPTRHEWRAHSLSRGAAGEIADSWSDIPGWKGAGTAVPVFALRSGDDFGVGEFLDLAKLVDWAAATGQSVIQILPINDTTMTGEWMDSYPYNANSTFALHPQFINLQAAGIVPDEEFVKLQKELNGLEKIDYVRVNEAKNAYLHKAFEADWSKVCKRKAYRKFLSANRYWLLPYAAFSVLRDIYGTAEFSKWEDMAVYDEGKVEAFCKKHKKEVDFYCFVQFHLDAQLRQVRNYAHSKGVILKGDLPIGISRTSVDAWQYPQLFNMDSQAGAPPDAFSADGQNWGFPTYNRDEGLVKVYESIANDIYYTDVDNMMIFAGNHDTERIADMLGHSVPRQKLVFTLLATLRGIPQVFYADELMGVSRDMRQGHGGLRIDFPLDWQNNPESVEVHDHFRRLFTWRKTASAIHNGGTIQFLRRDNTLAYFRYNDEQTVFVYANNSHEEKVIPWEDYREFTMAGAVRRGADSKELVSGTDIVGGNKVDFGQEIRIAPLSTMVVEFE